jgi:CdiI immunity protein
MDKQQRNRQPCVALRDFLRGYLHQDWKQEHGSPEQAAQHFWDDADSEQRRQLRSEWQAFVEAAKDQPLDEVARRLTELGSAWRPARASELDDITRVLQRYPSE